jgi:cell division protein FtsI (penicillin-binding protein 3)
MYKDFNRTEDKIKIFTVIAIFLFLFLYGRIIYIQLIKSSSYKSYLKNQIYKSEEMRTLRGNIYDRNGLLLAFSNWRYSYFCFPKRIKTFQEKQSVLAFVINKLKIPQEKISHQLNKYKTFFWITRGSDCQIDLEKNEIPKGIDRVKEEKRFYPNGTLASQVLGHTGLDNVGLSGIEYSMEDILKGNIVKIYNEKDAKGRDLDAEEIFKFENLNPKNIYLTIDKNIQFIVEKYLENLYMSTKAETVSAVIQNVKTGEIIAMANFPNSEINNGNKKSRLHNSIINKVYEPGSTLKILTMGAALEDGLYKMKDKIFCENGKFKVLNHTIRDHDRKNGYLSLEDILAFSSNIGMSKIGEKMGKDRLYYYFQKFGFGYNTGIDLPGEEKGLLRHPKNWDKLSIYILPFGQGLGVTPIQLISAISAVGNRGVLMEPKIIKAIEDKDILYNRENRVVRQILSEKVCRQLLDAMESVVLKGTAQSLKMEGYRIGAKTGTAQKIDPITRKYSKSTYVSSLVSIFPIDNPRFSILIVVDSPKGIYYGGEVCGKTMRNIIKDLIFYYKIPKKNK